MKLAYLSQSQRSASRGHWQSYFVTTLQNTRFASLPPVPLPSRCNLLAALAFLSSAHLASVSVLRPLLRPYLALLLLLCLGRTLLPEAWVLALHRHAHTTEVAAPRRPTGHEVLSTQHTHCHTEQFYNVPFAPVLPVRLPQPRVRAAYQPLAVATQLAASAIMLRRTALRGPPQA
jgi:hypothetical protein